MDNNLYPDTMLDVYKRQKLECAKVNDIVSRFEANGMIVQNIDLSLIHICGL